VLDARDLGPHLHPQTGVQVGKRLVHQEHARLSHDRPTHRHPLALPAGQLTRLPVEQILEPEHPADRSDPPLDLRPGDPPHLEPEGDVVVDVLVRVQRVILEDHGDVALLRIEVVDDVVADPDLAFRDLFESSGHPESGRLAAAGGPDEHHELTVGHLEREVVDRARAVFEDLRHVIEVDARHQPGPGKHRARARVPVPGRVVGRAESEPGADGKFQA
jgi:hypothetical protein